MANWYKNSQRWAFHGTSLENLKNIIRNGLLPNTEENGTQLFFSDVEDDAYTYSDGLMLKFPFPAIFRKKISGKGSYFTTQSAIPKDQIFYKVNYWDNWKPVKNQKVASNEKRLLKNVPIDALWRNIDKNDISFRGVTDGKDVWWWNSYDEVHDFVARDLALNNYWKLELSKNMGEPILKENTKGSHVPSVDFIRNELEGLHGSESMHFGSLNKKASSVKIDLSHYEFSLDGRIEKTLEFEETYLKKIQNLNFNVNEFVESIRKLGYPRIDELHNLINSNDDDGIWDLYRDLNKWLKDDNVKDSYIWGAKAHNLIYLIDSVKHKNGKYKGISREDLEQIKISNVEKTKQNANELAKYLSSLTNYPIVIQMSAIDKDNEIQPETDAIVYFGQDTSNSVFFSLFNMNGKFVVEDVFESGEEDTFIDEQQEAEYFKLINKIRNPNQQPKILTLYTSRPVKDRSFYESTKFLPKGIFLTSSIQEAEVIHMDLPGSDKRRDVWKVRVSSEYLTQTLDGPVKHYQAIEQAPLVSITPLSYSEE